VDCVNEFGGPRLALQCGSPTMIHVAEHSRLELSAWTSRSPVQLRCALQNHHVGPHMAHVHQFPHVGASEAMWLVWDDGLRDWRRIAHCSAYSAEPDYDICQIPEGHEGHHSWLLARHRTPV
jgi:hypothetical protein